MANPAGYYIISSKSTPWKTDGVEKCICLFVFMILILNRWGLLCHFHQQGLGVNGVTCCWRLRCTQTCAGSATARLGDKMSRTEDKVTVRHQPLSAALSVTQSASHSNSSPIRSLQPLHLTSWLYVPECVYVLLHCLWNAGEDLKKGQVQTSSTGLLGLSSGLMVY